MATELTNYKYSKHSKYCTLPPLQHCTYCIVLRSNVGDADEDEDADVDVGKGGGGECGGGDNSRE